MKCPEPTLKQLVSKSPYCIFWKDKDFKYAGCNQSFLKTFGMKHESEIIGKTDFDLPWAQGYAEIYRSEDEEVLNSNKSIIDKKIEVKLVTDESTRIFLVSKVPLTSNNENTGILCYSVDITKQEHDYAKLLADFDITSIFLKKMGMSESHNADEMRSYIEALCHYYESIISVMPGNVYWLNKDCVLLGGNKNLADMFGLKSTRDLVGLTYKQMSKYAHWTEGQGDSFRKVEREVMRTNEPRLNIEEPALVINNEKTYYLGNKVPILDKKGHVVGVVGVSIDITDKKKMEDQLISSKHQAEIASKSKSEFIANMSHDLRTPITGMLGLVQDMINTADEAQASLQQQGHDVDKSTPSKSNSLLTNIIAKVQIDGDLLMGATDELLQLCNEVLEVVCLETGKPSEKLESFNFHQLVQHNVELLQPTAQHKQLNLSYDIASDVPTFLKGLGIYLDRSLLNLISNALKFTEQGFVKVTAQLVNSNATTHHVGDAITLQITVQDSGIGIPKDKFDTIFEHFSRLTSSYQGVYKGAGLGLYTVKRYVEAMKGRITVDSEVGKGTCFTLTLPFTVSDHADRQKESFRAPKPNPTVDISTAKEEHATPISKEKATVTVLLVEDSALAAMTVKASLTSLGCAIDVAETGTQAVRLAERNAYDLILMDIGLPDFTGVEATKKIRALSDPKKAAVPIVAITGHAGNPDKRQEALDAGMQEVLNKPAQKLALELILDNYVFKQSDERTQPLMTPSDVPAEAELAVLDWDGCVRMCLDDPEMAHEVLSALAGDLKKTAPLLATHYANNDTHALRDTLHCVRGGVCYVKVPQLDHALKMFHAAVKAESQDPQHVKETYAAVQQAIDAFQKVWDARSKKHNP